ncbi:MAG: hypothetical protein VB118_06345 [Oscillospiraceae bacterium]|nr:hypothetical protein [Oscillospiraceae bacterium]
MKNISHRITRVICALLALMLTAFVFASCSDGNTPSAQTKTEPTAATETSATTGEISRENTPDKLPANIDLGGETVTIYSRNGYTKNFTAEDLTEEIMNDAVYNRQLKVEERLKVKIQVVENGSAEEVASKVKIAAQSNSDECDIAALRNYESYGLITNKIFYNYYENQYIDLTAPWWSQALINASTVGKDRIYVLMGDIDSSFISCIQAVFFNKGIYEKYIGNPDELYQTVIDRKWTVDKLIEVSKMVHDDVNGNGTKDKEDVYGYGASPCANQSASVNGVKIAYSAFNADGYPEMVFNNSHTVDAVKKLYDALWNNEGAYVTAGTQAGLDELTDKFKNETLMLYNMSVSSLGTYREMNTDYTVLPMPMLDEDQGEYCTQVSDGADGISVLVSCPDYDRACITLEALAAEGYRSVTYKYYETALKKAYARDDKVAQMLDILSNTVYFDFMFLHGSLFSNIGNFVPTKLLSKDAAGFGSEYDKIKDVYQKTLDGLLKFYQTGEE